MDEVKGVPKKSESSEKTKLTTAVVSTPTKSNIELKKAVSQPVVAVSKDIPK